MNPGSPGYNIEEERQAITGFLCTSYPVLFKHASDDSIEVQDTRAWILMASMVSDSFFIVEDAQGDPTSVSLGLPKGLASAWAEDYQNAYPGLFEGKRKTVKFFPHWAPMAGYSSQGADSLTPRRIGEMLGALRRDVATEGRNLSDVLFVPNFAYGKGDRQFSESIYHYVAGMVFRSMGYLVIDEYAPTLITGTARTPDLSAFRTPELVELMNVLRAKGVISSGAFLQELQLHGIFGKQTPPAPKELTDWTDADSIVIEVKRGESQYLAGVGSAQLQAYMSEAYGFYDEGYLTGPFITGPGTVSLGVDGKVLFERQAPSTSPAIADYWRTKKADELGNARALAAVEVLKNGGLSRTVEVCGGKDSVRTYEQLLRAVNDIDLNDAIRNL